MWLDLTTKRPGVEVLRYHAQNNLLPFAVPPNAQVVDALEGTPASKAERSSSQWGRRKTGGSAEAAPAGWMVYTRTVELSRLGAAWLGSVSNATATSAYEDTVVALANNTDPLSITAASDNYAGYDKDSVCFVEPMVRSLPGIPSSWPSARPDPHVFAKEVGCYSERRPLECRENPRGICPLAHRA